MPFFSIIIPTYNRASLIAQTIASVQSQIFTDWECIVVDDGSVDNTRNVIKNITDKDSRIRYIYQNNAERSVARNNGIENSTGDYICFLDSDDYYKENHLMILNESIISSNFNQGMFFTNYFFLDKGKQSIPLIPSLKGDIINYLCFNPIIPARVCIHKAILKNKRFDEDIVIVEDLLLWLKIAFEHPVIQIERETVVYNIHADNSINIKNNAAQKRLNGLYLFFNRNEDANKKIPSFLKCYLLGDTHFSVAKYHIYKNNKLKAIKHLFLSIYFQRFHSQLKHKLYIVLHLILHKTIPEYTILKV